MRKRFHSLGVAQKLALICVFFLMPDTVMLFLFVDSINANIDFAQLEKKGNEYQRPLEDLLQSIPRHGLLTQLAAAGNTSAAGRLPGLQARIEAAFDALESVDGRIGHELQFTHEGLAKRKREHYRPNTVRQEWRILREQIPRLSPEAAAGRHRHLVADVRGMISHVGDMSNLILDPDLDSYYLMDATLIVLPQMQDRMAAVMTAGVGILKQDAASSLKERQRLAIDATLLKEVDLERIVASTQTALNEDANYQGSSPTLQARLPQAQLKYSIAAESLIRMTTRLAEEDRRGLTEDEFLAAGEGALSASFTFWTLVSEELDTLLDRRIASYRHRRGVGLLVAAFALAAAIGFVTFITRTISAPLQRQAAQLVDVNEALRAEVTNHQRAAAALGEAQARLVKASRQAGMAEVATSVLHNVGNVLNSVSVSAEVAAGKVRQLRIGSLKSVAELLRQHAADLPEFLTRNPQGRELPDYLLKLAERLAEPQQGILLELDALRKNIEHIKEIVAMQQTYARGGGVLEPVALAELIEDAVRINAAGFGRHEVQLTREISAVPPLVTDRHKLLQILVNLLNNAKYALDRAAGDKRLIVRVAVNGAGGVRIEVIDNGVGIAPENLTQIFQHGFTTKKDGHGFGLHSGALTAKELGGHLTAHSDGVGCGAVFTLELPLQHVEARS